MCVQIIYTSISG